MDDIRGISTREPFGDCSSIRRPDDWEYVDPQQDILLAEDTVPMDLPTFELLRSRLLRSAAYEIPFDGVAYRSSTPKYATEQDLMTGQGSKQHGGRWNPVGIAAVYAALTPEAALAETLAHYRYYGAPIEDAMPRTFVAIRLKLRTLLDLRDSAVRRKLGVSRKLLSETDWRREMKAGCEPITQRLGRAAHAGIWEGMIVPSAVTGDANLVIFPARLKPRSEIELLNADKL